MAFLSNKFHQMQLKLTNQLRDFQHKISKRVVENTRANTLIIGDLTIIRMVCIDTQPSLNLLGEWTRWKPLHKSRGSSQK